METIEMKKKTYSPLGFIHEIATTVDRMPNRMNVWSSIFGDLDYFAAVQLITDQIEKEGIATSQTYSARPVGNSRGLKVSKTREIRFSVSKLIAFADRAGLDLTTVITN